MTRALTRTRKRSTVTRTLAGACPLYLRICVLWLGILAVTVPPFVARTSGSDESDFEVDFVPEYPACDEATAIDIQAVFPPAWDVCDSVETTWSAPVEEEEGVEISYRDEIQFECQPCTSNNTMEIRVVSVTAYCIVEDQIDFIGTFAVQVEVNCIEGIRNIGNCNCGGSGDRPGPGGSVAWMLLLLIAARRISSNDR